MIHLQGITQRLGKRLLYQLREIPDGAIPSREWNESARIYKDFCFGIMVEQRRRVELLDGRSPDDNLSDEQVELELKEIAMATLREMPEDKRREILSIVRAGERKEPIDAESEPVQ